MSQQLTISSLFSALALVALCLFARVSDVPATGIDAEQSLAQIEATDSASLIS